MSFSPVLTQHRDLLLQLTFGVVSTRCGPRVPVSCRHSEARRDGALMLMPQEPRDRTEMLKALICHCPNVLSALLGSHKGVYHSTRRSARVGRTNDSSVQLANRYGQIVAQNRCLAFCLLLIAASQKCIEELRCLGLGRVLCLSPPLLRVSIGLSPFDQRVSSLSEPFLCS